MEKLAKGALSCERVAKRQRPQQLPLFPSTIPAYRGHDPPKADHKYSKRYDRCEAQRPARELDFFVSPVRACRECALPLAEGWHHSPNE